ncbi:DUF4931 domain-containing protein [Bacillus timonensis]|nr:DUF4931 domain-containing protein [Bacillus timonensis]
MEEEKHLIFHAQIGIKKPETIVNKQNACPFCDRGSLTDIIEEKDTIIWLKNKYPTLENTFQTVIIETDNCNSELSIYKKAHLYRLISFGLERWIALSKDPEYSSVLFFKNHGPHSGGSLSHPHMQIVGLKNVNYHTNIRGNEFEGICITENNNVTLNISSAPRMGFYEFNIIMNDLQEVETFADHIQNTVHYVLNHFHHSCTSYNLFFYLHEESIIAKVMPRFPTSPLYVGYSIPQVSNKISDIAAQVKAIYYPIQ